MQIINKVIRNNHTVKVIIEKLSLLKQKSIERRSGILPYTFDEDMERKAVFLGTRIRRNENNEECEFTERRKMTQKQRKINVY